ncbi:hypothetical protein LVJ85_11720 [Neisseria sp. Dent CA1/247]|uniref:hypothetical protein n=1 Tax=Neisseria TaxID=482 RepID=UPI001FD361D2|nr:MULTISPECIES: hypothetical protein [Neisseria]MDO5068801.1 hypothetical protein [Neisseria zoodegmatis]UOO76657.1 hypothetical protein LVJ85_11720 [Neisseria sp. Dent CA1/247]
MKAFVYSALFTLGLAALPAHAVTYICKDGGKAVFSSEKINSSCNPSKMDGSNITVIEDIEEQPAPSAAAPTVKKDAGEIEKIWTSEKPGPYDDIKIDPNAPVTSVTNTANSAMEIKLRNQKSGKGARRAPVIVVPKVTTAPAQQQMSRYQILQNEIRTEQTALTRTQAQLAVARKKGDQAKIARLERDVRDREASIRAMKAEMKR